MTKSQAVLQRKDTTSNSALYISFDLGDKSWQISLGDDRFHVSRHTVAAGDTAAVASHILKAAARFKISGRSEVYSVYEAGRDGWWFHRWLCELGVDNIVVDPASIEVNRRARQAKTDRLDADKLLAMLIRHHAGERVWSVLHEPSREDEDARREHRELQRLAHERIAHTNRIGSLLVLHNLRPGIAIGGRDWAKWWASHRDQVPTLLRAELERECERLRLVKDQVRAIEGAHRLELAEGKQPLVDQLVRLRAIGPKGAMDSGQGGLRLAAFLQQTRTGEQPGVGADAARERQRRTRARHQQGGQPASTSVAGGAGMELVALAARQRADTLVQPALRGLGRTHAARGHRGLGQAPCHRSVAIPEGRRDPGRSAPEVHRSLRNSASLRSY